MQRLIDSWYRPSPLRWFLSPISGLYRLISRLRRSLYQSGLKKSIRLPVPVIIVGNISVGGSGKTPFVLWLSEALKQAGFQPGIISRGYGGLAPTYPFTVKPDSNPLHAGDEPILLAQRSGCPVMVAPDRVAAAQKLLAQHFCNVIIADDGLQHYRLQRDIEIAIVDADRGFGNGFCLPAGPLREPKSRLDQMDFVVWHGAASAEGYSMTLTIDKAFNLATKTSYPLKHWAGEKVHAVAAIGHPRRFFTQLKQFGLQIIEHPFADHHVFSEADLNFGDQLSVLMTEKDAVKCQAFVSAKMWSVPAEAQLDPSLAEAIIAQLKES